MSDSRPGRNTRIDLLRGVAIASVLLLHFSLTYRLVDSSLAHLLPVSWIRAVINNGNYGVTMFFAISGFLITSNNLARYTHLRDVRLGEFYALRFARIIPPLLLALLVIVPLGLSELPSFDNVQDNGRLPSSFFAVAVLSVLTFWHNVLMQHTGYFNYCLNIYWSLSVEEAFYLLFPLACVLLKRDSLMVVLCLVAIGLGPLYRGAHRDDELYFMYGYAACFDAIAFGCLAALLQRRIQPPQRIARSLRWLACLGVAITYLCGIDEHERLGFTLIGAFTALALLGCAYRTAELRHPAARLIGWFGRHSYELYLFHIVVLGLMREALPRLAVSAGAKLPLLLGFLALSAAVAALAARLYADPVNAGLRRLILHRQG